jgi:hypothetical protein
MTENSRSLDDYKAASLAAENQNYPARLNFTVEYAGATYQADPESYSEILAAAQQTELPTDFYWLDINNNKIPFNKQKIQELANIVFLKRLAVFNQHQNRKQIMKNATIIEDLFFNQE